MIERVTAYKSSDGKTFESLNEVQVHEIDIVLRAGGKLEEPMCARAANDVVVNREKILDILTTTERSKPKARAINGGKKSRKPKTEMATGGSV